MTDKVPPLPEPMGYVPFAGEFYQAAELDQEVKDDAETVWCFSMQQMRAYAEEAVRLEREAIALAIEAIGPKEGSLALVSKGFAEVVRSRSPSS